MLRDVPAQCSQVNRGSREEVSAGGTFSGSAGDQPKADTEGFREAEQVVVDVGKNKESVTDLQVKQHVSDMGGRNLDTAGAASTSQRAVTDSLINKNEVKIGAAAPPDSDSVVGQINESTVSSFTRKGVVFMSPKQVIMEECLVQNVQQVEKTDSVGRSETDFYSVDTLQSASEKLTDKGSAVNSRQEDSTAVSWTV
ncbi:hypothetical protein ACOSQ4_002894 [Xanthoceras sorbifolium]